MWFRTQLHTFMSPEGNQSASGGGATPSAAAAPAGAGTGTGTADTTASEQPGTATLAPDANAKPAAGTSGSEPGAAPKGDDKGDEDVDWRRQIAGDDPAMLKRLSRYNTAKDALNALSQLQERISKGELRSSLPKNATPEQVAEWRKENDIPEAPDKYELKLREGLTIGDEDKPIIDGFLKRMHGHDLSNKTASQFVEAYYDMQEEITRQRHEMDGQARKDAEDGLRDLWAGDFKVNRAIFENFANMIPTDVRDALLHGRAADGTPIGSSVPIINWMTTLARELSLTGTVAGSGTDTKASQIDSRIAEIERVMHTDRGRYNGDEKMQAEYRDLLTARERVAGNAR